MCWVSLLWGCIVGLYVADAQKLTVLGFEHGGRPPFVEIFKSSMGFPKSRSTIRIVSKKKGSSKEVVSGLKR